MRLTVLTDNTARIDAYYLAEAGVSYYIQDGGKNILFDTGYCAICSGVTVLNEPS